MTNPGPWPSPNSESAAGRSFNGLDNALMLIMIVAGLMLVLGVVVAFGDENPAAFAVAVMGLMTMIMCGLGRVVIHMSQTLDRIALDARELRGIEEWRLRQSGQ